MGASEEDGRILDLRSGPTIWERRPREPEPVAPLREDIRTEVVIIGSGITGAFIAERLTREGRKVVVLDRNQPQTASTAASTALLQWEIDAPLLDLEARLGFDMAAAVYRASMRTVRRIGALVAALAIDCDFRWRGSLLLAGNRLDAAGLAAEHAIRARAGIAGDYLTAGALAARYGFDRDAALAHGGSAEADPVALARGLMRIARERGAHVFSPALVTEYDATAGRAYVGTSEGRTVEAEAIILANGYEMPAFVGAKVSRVVSTWALATTPQPAPALWPRQCLVWEASDPYAYMRTTAANEIIIGGEDEDLADAEARDRLIPMKTARLLEILATLCPDAHREVAARWTGFFSETSDGLPLIGRVAGRPRCYAAFGYGGNGITFSALAAEMAALALAGRRHPLEEPFAVERDG